MAKAFEAIKAAASAPEFGKREAFAAVCGATDKMADIKLKGPASEMLLAASEAVGPAFVAGCLHRRAVAHKNPKVCTGAPIQKKAGGASFSLGEREYITSKGTALRLCMDHQWVVNPVHMR